MKENSIAQIKYRKRKNAIKVKREAPQKQKCPINNSTPSIKRNTNIQ